MLDKSILSAKLKSDGIVILKNYYDINFCEEVIREIEEGIDKFSDKVTITKSENTGGDFRLFGMDRVYDSAKVFFNETFFLDIINQVSKQKQKPYFILGGKLEYVKNTTQNSGGGWHRDQDKDQFKVMLYLNDVNSENGPFLFVKNSKTTDAKRIRQKQKDSLIVKIKKLVKGYKLTNPRYSDSSINNYLKENNLTPTEVTGGAGDIIIFNSSFLHRGKNISDSIRYSLTNYIFPDTLKQEKAIKNSSFSKTFIK